MGFFLFIIMIFKSNNEWKVLMFYLFKYLKYIFISRRRINDIIGKNYKIGMFGI